MCAVLCCVIPFLVCVTGNCALREHPAPSGALRPLEQLECLVVDRGGRETSAIRCIETTRPSCMSPNPVRPVREHPAPSGALRHARMLRVDRCGVPRQGASSTIRCICALAPEEQVVVLCPSARVAEADRHRGGAACGCGISISPVSFCSVVRTQGARIRQRCSHTRAELSRCVRCCVALFRSLCA